VSEAAPRARILLVEDERALVVTLVDRLRAERYEVEAVEDGERALERLGQASFDLVLLDLMLPGRDGYEVCRAQRAQGLSVPVLMLTARAQVVDRVVGLKLGADDYLVKPFDLAELLARVEALLRRGRAEGGRSQGTFAFGDGAGGLPPRRGRARRRGGAALEHGVQAALLLHRAPRRAAVAQRAPRQGVGLRRRAAEPHGRRPRRCAPPEARARPRAPGVHPHRPPPGVPVRGLARSPLAGMGGLRTCPGTIILAPPRPEHRAGRPHGRTTLEAFMNMRLTVLGMAARPMRSHRLAPPLLVPSTVVSPALRRDTARRFRPTYRR
jgi:DNA-binding response OmpR family regulator